jgi:hypothetical protein
VQVDYEVGLSRRELMLIRADNGRERLATLGCYRPPASQRLGRIGLVGEGHPEIFPVT